MISDGWAAYAQLKDHCFDNQVVIHDEHFVDLITGAHTLEIESNWRALKRRICRGGIKKDCLADHLCKYLWDFWRWETLNSDQDLFLNLSTVSATTRSSSRELANKTDPPAFFKAT